MLWVKFNFDNSKCSGRCGEVGLRPVSVWAEFDQNPVLFSHVNEHSHVFYLSPNTKWKHVKAQIPNLLKPLYITPLFFWKVTLSFVQGTKSTKSFYFRLGALEGRFCLSSFSSTSTPPSLKWLAFTVPFLYPEKHLVYLETSHGTSFTAISCIFSYRRFLSSAFSTSLKSLQARQWN